MKSLYKAMIVRILPLALFILITGALKVGAQGKFIQNIGQWDDTVVSRADIKSGAIFLCKDQIRYNFLNAKDEEPLHSDPYMIDTCRVRGQSFFLKWIHSNPDVQISSQNEYPEYYNYFIGNDPTHWKSGVHAYSDVNYEDLYRGINLSMSAEGTNLEYTYTVIPGADPSRIKIKITGASDVAIEDSDLIISSPLVSIMEKSPYAYQVVEGIKTQVPCLFVLKNGIESFSFPQGYDNKLPLIIDPVVIFATFSGAADNNFGFTGTYDSLGYSYGGGDAFGAGFPTTAGAYMSLFQGGTNASSNPASPSYIDTYIFGGTPRDVGLLKFSPDGKKLIYATYLGGKKGNEQPTSMVVDHSGNLVVFGTTASSDFPVTSNAFQSTLAGKTDMYISKFSPDGKKLLASTLIGGSNFDGINGLDTSFNGNDTAESKLDYNYGDQFRGEIVTDQNNNFYVASSTFSSNFPVTSGAYQTKIAGGRQDGLVLKIDSNLHTLIWSTFLGGAKTDGAYSLVLDHSNNVFVCGGTLSPYFFPSGSAYQKSLSGDVDGYICHLKNDGSAMLGATYYGTSSYDQAFIVRLDDKEDVYVYGQTENTNFPAFNVKYTVPHSGDFITKFNNSLDSIIFSSDFGSGKGRPDLSPSAFLVDKCGKIYISGWGGSVNFSESTYLNKLGPLTDMPITKDAFQKSTVDQTNFYLAVFEQNMDTLLYASYFGGADAPEHVHGGSNDFDKNGIIYQSVCGGCGGYSDFPTTPGAWSRTNNGPNCNNVVFKVDLNIADVSAGFIAPKPACTGVPVSFINTSFRATSLVWDFGDSSTKSTNLNPIHKYAHPGTYTVTLTAINPYSCKLTDTARATVVISGQGNPDFTFSRSPCSLQIHFSQNATNTNSKWDFGDGITSDSANPVHTFAKQGAYVVRLLVDSGTSCSDSFNVRVNINGPKADFTDSFAQCSPTVLYFKNLSTGSLKSREWYFPFASTDTSLNPVFNFGSNSANYNVSLVVTDSTGCKDSSSKPVTVYSKPGISFTDSLNACATTVFVRNTSTGTKTFKWYFSDGTTSAADSIKHVFPNDSVVSVTLITDSGTACTDTLKKNYKTILPKTGYNFAIDTCTGTVVFTNTSQGATTFNWRFDPKDSDTAKNAIHIYKLKGEYPVKLTAYSSSGCVDTLTKFITISASNRNLYIPNVFTPNGDEHNNTFVITGLDPCDSYDLEIYNRWGQEFYHQIGTYFSWDGIYHGVKVPEGVYYYVFHGRKEGQLTGCITVIY